MTDLIDDMPQEVQLPRPKKPLKSVAKEPAAVVHRHAGRPQHYRDQLYNRQCLKCIQEDEQRRGKPQVHADDLERTIFLFPDMEPEAQVARLYIEQHYGQVPYQGSTCNLMLVTGLPDTQIVCVRRCPQPGKALTEYYRRILQADNKWIDVKAPFEELLGDVIESEPINVQEAVGEQRPSLLVQQAIDTNELVDRLCDVFAGYRVIKMNAPDTLVRVTSW